MDLKQYKVKIRNQLLSGLDAQAKREKAIEEGDYVTSVKGGRLARPHYQIPKEDYDDLLRRMSVYRDPTISMPTTGGGIGRDPRDHEVGDHEVVSDDPTDVGGSFNGKNVVRKTMKRAKALMKKMEDQSEDVVEGGKFHFMKSIKHFGNDLGTAVKKAGISAAAKEIASTGVKYAKDNIGKMMSGAEEMLPEALPVAEEAAPMMLMAAGMQKKPKRTRKISQKEANRHALIRKLMKQHGCSLAEASQHIKENGLAY